MFLAMNSLAEAGMVVVSHHRHCGLHEDPTGVHFLAHEMGGATRQSDPGPESLANGVHPAEARQKGWMDVHDPFRKGPDQGWSDDPHPAGHHHEIHGQAFEAGDQGLVEGFATLIAAMIQKFPGDPEPFVSGGGSTTGVVDHQLNHLGRETFLQAGHSHGFEVASVPGSHHRKPQRSPSSRWIGGRLADRPLDGKFTLASVVKSGHPVVSHLSILPTVLRDAALLQTCLRDLGHEPNLAGTLDGFSGEQQKVELWIQLDDGLTRSASLQTLLGSITRRYAAIEALHRASHDLSGCTVQLAASATR
jgi:hypothetical protein